jgi:inorganic pyrophosphatase
MAKKPKNAYVAPTILKPFNKRDQNLLQVVIETPKGSRNKYKFDPKLGGFKLSKTLPAGMDFPYDFGFVPSTEADDGDPIDVLLLMDESAFPGCIIDARLVGIIEGEQQGGGSPVRNDRLIAVAEANHMYSEIRDVADLSPKLRKELEEFFMNYHNIDGKKFKVLGCKGPKEADKMLRKAMKQAA